MFMQQRRSILYSGFVFRSSSFLMISSHFFSSEAWAKPKALGKMSYVSLMVGLAHYREMKSRFVLLALICGFLGTQAAAEDMPDIPSSLADEKPARVNTVEQMLYYKLVRSNLADNDGYVDLSYIMANESGFVDEDVNPGSLALYQTDIIGSIGVVGRRSKGGDQHLNLFVVGYTSGGYGQPLGRDTVIGLSYYHDDEGALHLGPVLHEEHTGRLSARMFVEGDLIPTMVRAFLELDPVVPKESTGLGAWRVEPESGVLRQLELGGGYNGFLLSPDWRTRVILGPHDQLGNAFVLVAEGDPENPLREAKGMVDTTALEAVRKDALAGLEIGVSYLRSSQLIDHAVGFSFGFTGKLFKGQGDDRQERMSLLFGWRGNWVDDLRRAQSAEQLFTTYFALSAGGS
jgi:hypothetical protein